MAKKQFKAESKRLLDLMINSIYTHQEIFLREIISNASDAIDKLAYLSLTDQNVGLDRGDFAIRITADEKNRMLTVSDNGIGMDRAEMEENLGTIAKSGSLQFKKDMEEQKEDIDIIGQFGVGFYSAFMVAEAVTVISRKYGADEAWMWQSSGAEGYTMTACEKDCAGTDIIMKLKADTDDEQYSRFLQEYELRRLVKKYSDYIRYPIQMDVTKQRVTEESKDSEKPEYESYTENETLNSMVPLWQRNKKDVTAEAYSQFYKDKFFDFEDPIAHLHLSVEGAVTYKALLYVPARAPYDFYTKEFKKGLQLYSSGVMIMENCEDLLPEHFRFVRGVVDSQDLSLNISRELLQHDRQLKFIAGNLEKKIKAELAKLMKDDREKYERFFGAFGRNLKYGIVADYGAHKELLQDLMLFWSSRENKLVSLKEYTEAMGEEQKYIYFAVGESRERLAQLPQLELLREKGCDVLFFTEDVDEFIPQTLQKYAEKEFRNIAADDLGLTSDEEKKAIEEKQEAAKPTLDFIKETLGDKVKEVRLSAALKSHPVCLAPEAGMSFEMEKYFQRMSPEMGVKAGRILELNAAHPVFAALQLAVAQDKEKAEKYVRILYAQALLMADLPLENPTEYTDLICGMMQ
ncbi:MAG: molecular chaperone HtpG [Oscillospiraceae bacterium]|nr:molecular chaperone HtpG [Oscillospiraceae bacterium]